MDKTRKLYNTQDEKSHNCMFNVTNNSDAKYSWCNYIKKHPGVFTTIFTTIGGLILLLLNMISFYSTASYLSYFNVDSVYITMNTEQLYHVVVTIILTVAIGIECVFTTVLFEKYVTFKRTYLLSKYKNNPQKYKYSFFKRCIIKLQRKKFAKKVHRAILTQPRILNSNKYNCKKIKIYFNSKKSCKETHRAISTQSKILNLNKCNCKETKTDDNSKKSFRKYLGKRIIEIVGIFFLMWFILTVFFSFMIIKTAFEPIVLILTSVFISFIYLAVLFIFNWFVYCIILLKRSQIRKDAINSGNKHILSYDENLEKKLFDENIFNHRINIVNFDLVMIVVTVLVTALMFCLALSFSQSSHAEEQRDFFIVQDEETFYAVIYNNGEQLVLEKADMSKENTLIIHKNDQKVIDVADVKMEKIHFDDVIIQPKECN